MCCGVDDAEAGEVLERGVRGKKDNLAKLRGLLVSMFVADGTSEEFERKVRLRFRKDGARECLGDLRGRGDTGVIGSYKVVFKKGF